ncbi:MAG: hypothetical protein IT260_00065 [Saprospiraceae bacterium]|nr:hypothetical protein [Saprospiraceae bacterium]
MKPRYPGPNKCASKKPKEPSQRREEGLNYSGAGTSIKTKFGMDVVGRKSEARGAQVIILAKKPFLLLQNNQKARRLSLCAAKVTLFSAKIEPLSKKNVSTQPNRILHKFNNLIDLKIKFREFNQYRIVQCRNPA